MKGMLDFLEKAGLVRRDDRRPQAAAEPGPGVGALVGEPTPAAVVPPAPVGQGAGGALRLEEIYATEGVAPSAYPAERLLRVVDGLSAMDEATRNIAIKAIDAADDSWSISDPLRDASAKLTALAAHAGRVKAELQQAERETQGRLDASRARQDKVIGDIRRQISELEALATRELARGAQEVAVLEAGLVAAREQSARETAELDQITRRLQSLAAQFGSFAGTSSQG